MGHGRLTLNVHTLQQGARADTCSTKQDIVTRSQILRPVNTVELIAPTIFDKLLLLRLICWPYFSLLTTTETSQTSSRKHCLRSPADTGIKIHIRARQRWRHSRGDIPICDHAQLATKTSNLFDNILIAWPVQHHHRDVAHVFAKQLSGNLNDF